MTVEAELLTPIHETRITGPAALPPLVHLA
jgi:hypothetical protein